MKKIFHIRGEKDYFLELKKEENTSVFNFANKLSLSWKKSVFTLWEDTFGISYLEFRRKLRELSLENTKKINYFDTILYNDTEYQDFITNTCAKTEDYVIFSQDDDDFILPTIHDVNITPGLNIYIWPNVHYWKGKNKVVYSDHTPTTQNNKLKYHKIKSSHFCYRKNDEELNMLNKLSNHRKISDYTQKNKVTYHNTYFNLYIWHPSSLCFLNTLADHWQFIGDTSPFTHKEQQNILKLNIERIKRLMDTICKKEDNKDILTILKQIKTLYNEYL